MNYIEIAKEVLNLESQAMKEAADKIDQSFSHAVEIFIESRGKVVVTGMGKSGLVGKKIAATLASTGTPAFFMHPGEAYHGDLGMISKADTVLAISQSGETEEIIRLLSFFKNNQNQVVALTGNSESTLAKNSTVMISTFVKKEACPLELAPTASTTLTMALGDALAVSLMKARNFQSENFARFHPGGSLGRKLLTKVADCMRTEDLPTVSMEAGFKEVLYLLSRGRLGMVVVTDSQEKVFGIITDGDIRRVLEKEEERALSLKASDLATQNPKSISGDIKIVEAEQLMLDQKITVLIVKEGEKLRGILHLYDL